MVSPAIPAYAQDLANRARQFDATNVECLLDALGVAIDFPHELLPRTREFTQSDDFCGGDETTSHEPMSMEVCHPGRVVDVTLAARKILDVRGIGQRQLEPALQDVPHRLPVAPRRFHDDMSHAFALQPRGEAEELLTGCLKRTALASYARGVL